ncbi:hypothetical protein HPB48_014496 [Haemaphysalis longicornis]|uniref:Uncharacterized protein n=1 Tax=Haemaphysalis longicornis TaxID=44386 RepID=A0A9J6GLE3_HAELO|nr:hypothetical protein HPB48_014496 [Haemaphysalis longicornis]
MLKPLNLHRFVTKQRASYFRHINANLSQHEAIMVVDVAEKFSFILQDAPQSYRLVNTQASIHPVVLYIRNKKSKSTEVSVRSFAII